MLKRIAVVVMLMCSIVCKAFPAVSPAETKAGGRQVLDYWDQFDFKDSLRVTQPDFIRRTVTRFLDIVQQLPAAEQRKAADAFTAQTYGKTSTRLYFSDEVEQQLFNPASERHDDRLYMVFLQSALASPLLPEEEKSRYRFQLENAGKNLPGNPATDFTYLNKEGKRRKMSDVTARYLVLFFYNPDCDRCRKAEQLLEKNAVLNAPGVKVLAVYPGPLTKEWLEHTPVLPAAWINGCSPDGEINNRLLYFIRTTPAIYLLDSKKNVILKDVSPEKLINDLRRQDI